MRIIPLLSSLLLLWGCTLETPPTLTLTLLADSLEVREGEEAVVVVQVEGKGLREVLLSVEGVPSPPPPRRVGLGGSRKAEERLPLSLPPGEYAGEVVAEGGGLKRRKAFRLRVQAHPEGGYLQGVVYVGGGLGPQSLGRRVVAQGGEGEPLFPAQWNLPLAGFPEAWKRSRGKGVVVAVLDTGVLPGHPDLEGALLPGLDLVDGDTDPREPPTGSPQQTFHGSHVAGVLAAPWQGLGMAGASQARVLPIRILGPDGSGQEEDLVRGLRFAAGLPVAGLPPNPYPARIVNLSLAGEGACGAALQEAVDGAVARGVLVVAAAGNYARDYRDYFPANCRGVLPVGAVGRTGPAPYTNRGAPLLAPGGDGSSPILGPGWDGGYGYRGLQGTSQAAPHVAAAAALLWAAFPQASREAVAGALLLGEETGYGRRLRADLALMALEGREAALRVEGEVGLLPGEEGSLPVEVLSPYPVRVEVLPEGGLSAYLSPNPAQGRAHLRVRAGPGLPPGDYRVSLRVGQAGAEARVRVGEAASRVVLEACPEGGPCTRILLPKEGGPFRLEGLPGRAHRLLAFLDRDGDGVLDPGEPRGTLQATPPASGLALWAR